MTSEDPKVTETEEQPPSRDLRTELMENLSTEFAAQLETDNTLPSTAQEALIALLKIEAPTSASVIAALSKRSDAGAEEADE